MTSSLLKLYALAKYLDASSAISATLVMFFAMTLILAEADINHSGLKKKTQKNLVLKRWYDRRKSKKEINWSLFKNLRT